MLRADRITTAIKALALIAVPIALALVQLSTVEQGPTLCLFHTSQDTIARVVA